MAAAGRSPHQRRCSHSNFIFGKPYKTNEILILFGRNHVFLVKHMEIQHFWLQELLLNAPGCFGCSWLLLAASGCFWLPGCLAAWLPGCLVAWLPGCLATWLPGCLAAWMPDCLIAWLPGCLAAWLPGCLVAWLAGCLVAWLSGCLDAGLPDCLAAWLPGCLIAWLPGCCCCCCSFSCCCKKFIFLSCLGSHAGVMILFWSISRFPYNSQWKINIVNAER